MKLRRVKMDITKIVITGGPCAGKTTALSRIRNYFSKMGYTVLIVPETATELISGGVAPWTCKTNLEYQLCHMKLQLEKEAVFVRAASKMEGKKALIVCDRGVTDCKAYMTARDFEAAAEALGADEVDLRDGYDAVFHLVTAAKGAEEFYTLSNNEARTETLEQARELDDALISAWTGHPHFRVICNDTDFEGKMKKLTEEIASVLGEPEPFEIEHKYLIEYPDISYLESLPNCRKVEIIQTYLKTDDGHEARVRQRGAGGSYIYFKTEKIRVSDVKRVEIEQRLTQKEYLTALMDADTSLRQIRKTRYCLSYGSQYFEIDVYPFWSDKAVVEVELSNENEKVIMPDFIKVIKEVTDDRSYSNYELAKTI